MTLRDLLEAELKAAEGLRLMVYDDATSSILKPGKVIHGHPTIGYGRALDRKGITPAEAQILLDNDIDETMNGAATFPWMGKLNLVRQMVICSMVFQMGVNGVAGFHDMIDAIERGDWEKASEAMLDSDWARIETPARAHRLAEKMKAGV